MKCSQCMSEVTEFEVIYGEVICLDCEADAASAMGATVHLFTEQELVWPDNSRTPTEIFYCRCSGCRQNGPNADSEEDAIAKAKLEDYLVIDEQIFCGACQLKRMEGLNS